MTRHAAPLFAALLLGACSGVASSHDATDPVAEPPGAAEMPDAGAAEADPGDAAAGLVDAAPPLLDAGPPEPSDGGLARDAGPLADAGADAAGTPERATLTHLVVAHWPHGFTDWAIARSGSGLVAEGDLAALPASHMSVVTGLRRGRVEGLGTGDFGHAYFELPLWSGHGTIAPGVLDSLAMHPSFDQVVAERLGVEPIHLGIRQPSSVAHPLSWGPDGTPSFPSFVDEAEAARLAPCSDAPLPAAPSLADARRDARPFWEAAEQQSIVAPALLGGGCSQVVTIELGDMGNPMRVDGDPRGLYWLWHETRDDPVARELVASQTRRFAEWVAGLWDGLERRLHGSGHPLSARTLLVVTTGVGGAETATHSGDDLPIFLFSRSEQFLPGVWIEAAGAPHPRALQAIAGAFGASATFQPPGEPAAPLSGLFVP